ncbi:MAG TPA: Ig-like domain-containing protein [bacterium]
MKIVLFIFLISLMTTCGFENDIPLQKADYNYSDITGPTVISIIPAPGEKDVRRDSGIIARFSEPVNTESVSELSFILSNRDGQEKGTYLFSPDSREVTFIPSRKLSQLMQYTVAINSRIEDLNQNPLTDQDPNDKLQFSPFLSSFVTGE